MTALQAPTREQLPPSATVAFRRCLQHLRPPGERVIAELLDKIGREAGGRNAVLDLLAAFEPRFVSAMCLRVSGDHLPLLVIACSIVFAEASESCVALASWRPWLHASLSLLGRTEVDCSSRIAPRIPIPTCADGSIGVGISTSPSIDRESVQLGDSANDRGFSTILKFKGDGKARWDRMVLDALAIGGIRR